MPTKRTKPDAKARVLRAEGTLHGAPEKVRDPKFRAGEFFDPRDAVQVKYEMLRRVLVDKASVTEVAAAFGVSRPTFYEAKSHFEAAGIAGLVARKPGPRGPRKLRGDVLAFVARRRVPGAPLRARAGRVDPPDVRPRRAPAHHRASARGKRDPAMRGAREVHPALAPAPVVARYEALRAAALGAPLPPEARCGLVLFLRRGMWAWARALAAESAPAAPTRATATGATAPQPAGHVVQVLAALVQCPRDGSAS